jgi:hypothetical protein
MAKRTEVYTWRVSRALKTSLEEAARNERRSMAGLLEAIVMDHLRRSGEQAASQADLDRRLHRRAELFAGRIASGKSGRAEAARALVRERLGRQARGR